MLYYVSFLLSGIGWESIDHSSSLELQSRLADGEFWLDETEFRSQFDDITVGYPTSGEGHLKSIYTGKCLFGQRVVDANCNS